MIKTAHDQENEETGMTRKVVEEALEAQGKIQPGEQGWWQVWAANASNVREGDMVMVIWSKGTEDEEHAEYLIDEVLLTDACGRKCRSSEGETFWLGMLQPIILLRQGTHHTLA